MAANDTKDLPADDLAIPQAPVVPRWVIALGFSGLLLLIAGLYAVGLFPKLHRDALAKADAAARLAPIKVATVRPKQGPPSRALALPASVQPLHETTVFPRASGYVRSWRVDIGDRVTAGQLLAEIDTPELDQELLQAQATLGQREASIAQAKASLELSRTQLKRVQALAPSGVASQQELEQREAEARVNEANLLAAEAALKAQRANVSRLRELKSFARVTAPFAGLITARNIDRGSLVSAGGGSGSRLFTLAVTDPVRVYVQVPQRLAALVQPGLPAQVSIRELPGRTFSGRVERTAGALDPTSRTLTTEVRVPNGKGELLGGMYAQVNLTLSSPTPSLRVPAAAILSRAEGLRVAVVGKDSKIRLVPVSVERDDGADVEIGTGLTGDEQVVANPGARIEEGLEVVVAKGS